jgi:carboxylate-amine ligase
VHVAVPGADRALAVFNAARSFLPEITALAANSPFVDGSDSRLASSRGKFTLAVHRAGVPPEFESWERFVEFVEWGRRGGLLPDASHLWWDLRPHPRFGTLELRSADAQTRLADAVAIAAVYQALLVWLSDRFDTGERLPVHDTCRIAENVWRATRYGTRGWMVDHESGEPEETRARVSGLLETLEPAAQRLGTTWALLTAQTLVADNGADRQRYVAERDGLTGLVRWLADETVSSAREYLEQRG